MTTEGRTRATALLGIAAMASGCIVAAVERPRASRPDAARERRRAPPPRYDRWYGLQANGALQLGGADVDFGGVVYLGGARGSLDPDRVRPATERSPFRGVGLELVTSVCARESADTCPGRTSLGPAVRTGIAWIELPESMAHIYVQASGLLGHEHGSAAGIQGAGGRASVGYSLLPLAFRGPLYPSEDWLLLLVSHIEASFEVYYPSGGPLARGFGIALGFGF